MSDPARLFISTMLYAASKRLGYRAATAELMAQVTRAREDAKLLSDPLGEWKGMPCALSIARATLLENARLNVNAGATVIGKARSLAAAEFLASGADVWLSVDDDVIVTLDALEAMVSQARAEPCCVIAPCLLRSTVLDGPARPVVNISQSVAVQAHAPTGGLIETIETGGFGAFALSREVVERAHELAGPERDWLHEGKPVRALFRDEIRERQWVTEDVDFCSRFVRPVFRLWAVRVGQTVHAGQRLDLESLEGLT